MKKSYLALFRRSLLMMLFTQVILASGQNYPGLKIISDLDTIILDPGQLLLVQAEYYGEDSTLQDVSIKWHTDPGYLGKVDRDGNLNAYHPGEGFLYAMYHGLIDSIPLLVTGQQKNDNDDDNEVNYPKVKIIPGSVKIESTDSVELRAFYINEIGEKQDTFFHWSVSDTDIGMFLYDTISMFYADQPGQGYIIAALGELADTIKLKVVEPKTRSASANRKRLTIIPDDTAIYIQPGGTMQYDVVAKNIDLVDSLVKWSVSNESVATIDEATGLLTLGNETGISLVKVTYEKISAFVELLVVDSTMDLEVNTITVHRVLPDGHELPPKRFLEGESYKIGGLPFPLNILNAGMLHFPFGCIHEDITLYMFIPEEYAETDDDSLEVNFSENIITGVKFSVMPNDSGKIIEPYQFDVPVILSLVFKHELLDSLQINPEDLDVFFADNTGFTEADDKVAIDTIRNRIYANIEHFSTIVVRQKSGSTNVNILEDQSGKILEIYPNPFQTSAQITYKLSEESDVNITIYNILGKQVKTLVNGTKQKGNHTTIWNGISNEGNLVNTGFYICRIMIDGRETESAKIILNR